MQTNYPIGLFDSGIGGVSIWKEIHKLLPNEATVYLADSKNAPYGVKTKEEIVFLSEKNTEFLLHQNCKIVVVACNTATTNAIKELREKYDVPFIGIEPAIKPAALQSKTHRIGILATKGTLNSQLFHKNVAKYENITIIEQVGHGLVQLIENGAIHSTEMNSLLQQYLQPMIAQNIDYLVLGCSHYPFLIDQIRSFLPKKIKIIDSGKAVAKQTHNILKSNNLLQEKARKPNPTFYTNGNSKVLQSILGNHYLAIEMDF